MIDPFRLAVAVNAASPMRAIMDRVAADRAAVPSGVAPVSIPRPPRYDPTPDLIAASLAGGMIAAGGKAVTAEEAVGMFREVRGVLQS